MNKFDTSVSGLHCRLRELSLDYENGPLMHFVVKSAPTRESLSEYSDPFAELFETDEEVRLHHGFVAEDDISIACKWWIGREKFGSFDSWGVVRCDLVD